MRIPHDTVAQYPIAYHGNGGRFLCAEVYQHVLVNLRFLLKMPDHLDTQCLFNDQGLFIAFVLL